MNIARIDRANGLYNTIVTDYGVNGIGASGGAKAGPAGGPAVGLLPGQASKGRAPAIPPLNESVRAGVNLAAVYSSPDGDRAEISNKAMDLWRGQSAPDGGSPARPSPQQPGIGLPFDHHLDVPSPFLDWADLINNTGAPMPQSNAAAPDISPPGPAAPDAAPADAASPGNATLNPADSAPADSVPANAAPPGPAPQYPLQASGAPVADGKPTPVLPDVKTGSFNFEPIKPKGECKTCESRKYVDQSDDPSVSFQTPTKLSPSMAASAVASHENEHVSHEKGKAQREGREIVNQTVTFTYDVCPECGRRFVSGGTTHTMSVSKPETDNSQPASAGAASGRPPASPEKIPA